MEKPANVNGSDDSRTQSRESSSKVSSQANTNTTAKSKMVVASISRLTDQSQWFTALLEVVPDVSRKLSALGLFIDWLQLMGILLSGHFMWGTIIGSPIGRVLYATNIPFFDPTWSVHSQETGIALFWITFACLLSVPISIVARVVMDRDKNRALQVLQRTVIESFSSWLLIPAAQFLMSGILCRMVNRDNSKQQMYWYPDYTCDEALARVMRGLGVIGLALLVGLTYLSTMFLHDDTIFSNSLMTRAHSGPVFFAAVCRVATPIFFQIYAQQERSYVFAIFLAVICFVQLIYFVATLPYHHILVTQIRCGTLLSVCAVAILAALTLGDGWVSAIASTIAVGLCAAIGFIIGFFLPLLRLDGEFRSKIQDLKSGMLQADTATRYPLNLPKRDLVFSSYKTLEADLTPTTDGAAVRDDASSAGGSENGEGDGQDLRPLSILLPYISRVLFALDIEVASRSLQVYQETVGIVPPDGMKAYVSRIFTKGVAKWPRSPGIILHFAYFLITARRNYLALNEVEKIGSAAQPAAIHQEYRAHCVLLRLKTMLNMTDAGQSKMLARTHRLHKDILVQYTRFWDKVLSADSDVKNLAKIADAILTKRTEAQDTFTMLLQRPTKSVLSRFARFLDEVMLMSQQAQMITEVLAEDNEKKKRAARSRDSSGGGGSRLGFGSIGGGSTAMSGNRGFYDLLNGNASDDSVGSGVGGITSQSLLLGVLLVLLLLGAVALFIFTGIHEADLSHRLEQLFAAAQCRTLVALGTYLTGEIEAAASVSATGNSTLIAAAQLKLSSVADQFDFYNKRLTFGDYLPTSDTHKMFLQARITEVILATAAATGAAFTRDVDSLTNIGDRISAAFHFIASTSNVSSSSAAPHMNLILLNGLDSFAAAYNRSVVLFEEASAEARAPYWLFLALLMVIVALLATATHGAVLFHLQRVRFHHLAALSLFTQIPRKHLATLRDNSVAKLEAFENEGGELEVDIPDTNDALEAMRLSDTAAKRPAAPASAVVKLSPKTLPGAGAKGEGHADSSVDSSDTVNELINSQDVGKKAGAASSNSGSDGIGDRSVNSASGSGSDMAKYMLDDSNGNSTDLPGHIKPSQSSSRSDEQAVNGKKKSDKSTSGAFEDSSGGRDETDVDSEVESDETKKVIQDEDSTSVEIPWTTLRNLAFIAIVLAALGVGLGFSFQLGGVLEDMRGAVKKSERRLRRLHDIYSTTLLASDAVRGFTQNFNLGFPDEYSRVMSSSRLQVAHRELLLEAEADTAPTFLMMQSIVDAIEQRHEVALYLTATAYNLSAEAMEIHHIPVPTYNYSQASDAQRAMFAGFLRSPGSTDPTDNSGDQAKNSSARLLAARSLVYDSLYAAHFTLLERYRGTIALFDSDLYDKLVKSRDTATGVAIGCFGFVLLLTSLSFFVGSIRRNEWLVGLLLLLWCIVAAFIGIVATQYIRSDRYSKDAWTHLELLDSVNHTLASITQQRGSAETFLQFGDPSFFRLAETGPSDSIWTKSLSDFLNSIGQLIPDSKPLGQIQTETNFDELLATVTSLRRTGEFFIFSSLVGLKQSVWALGVQNLIPQTSLENLQYDRSREVDALTVSARYSESDLGYTDSTTDQSQPAEVLASLARLTFRGQAVEDVYATVKLQLAEVAEKFFGLVEDNAASQESMYDQLRIAAPVLGFVAIAIFLIATVTSLLSSNAEEDVSTSVTGLALAGEDSKDDFKYYFGLCLTVVVMIFLVPSVYDAVIVQNQVRTIRTLNRASELEWQVLQSAGYSQRLRKATNEMDRTSAQATLAHLRLLYLDMERSRLSLYLGEVNDAGPNGLGSVSSHDAALWGEAGTSTTERFAYDCPVTPVPSSLADTSRAPQFAYLNRDITGTSAEQFQRGFDISTVNWMIELLALAGLRQSVEVDTPSKILAGVASLRSKAEALSFALIDSKERYYSEIQSNLQSETTISYILAALALITPLVVFFAVLRPKLRELSSEEDGTRLLVRMIPSNVQHDVPAISHYVETGQILQDPRMKIINEAVNEMSAVALVVIDWSGTISIFSKAAEVEFGYVANEVIGKNIKMLMPQEYSKNHDQYLENYRRTGVKKIIDKKRRVMARRKDGTLFPVEANIREFKKNAKESNFLGYLRNITAEIETERVAKLNEAVSDMASVPVIVIKPNGKIYRVNRAATVCYGYTEKQLVNHNIKKIMPTAIAKRHDSFLAEYTKTRVKKVVDNVRHATGRRQNGDHFPVEITVREMLDDFGEPEYFVGYTRDITNEKRLQQSLLANEAAIAISPMPVISIDTIGTIQMFSPAAEKAWGYSASDVKGQNVKMLMTADDAKHHDGYLARYLKTGEKHVIGSKRTVTAKRSNGTQFSIDLLVQELRREEGVSYLAYVKDNAPTLDLQSAEERSRAVSAQNPQPVVMISEVGIIQLFNKAAEKLFGFLESECLGQNVTMLMPEDIAVRHDKILARYMSATDKTTLDLIRQVTGRRKNGKEFPVELTLREVIVKDLTTARGQRTIFIGYFRSLQEEMSLNLKTTLQQVLTLSSTIAIRPDGTVIEFSKALANVFGYEPEEVIGQNVKMLMPEKIAKQHDGFLERYRVTGVKNVLERPRTLTALKKSKEEFLVHLTVREVKVEGVETVYVAAVVDVTDDIRLEDEAEDVRTAFSVSPTPIIVINGKGIITRFSEAATRTFGYLPEDIIGKNVKILMPAQHARLHDGYLRQYIKTGIKNVIDTTRKVQAHRRDGTLISIELSVKEIIDPSVELGARVRTADRLFLGFARDLSQEYVLQQSNSLKDIVLAGSPIPLVQINTTGTILYANAATLTEFRYPNEAELIGKNVRMLMPQPFSGEHDSYLKRYLETGEKRIIDQTRRATALRKDGEKFSVEISVREVFTSEGEKRFVGYIRSTAQDDSVLDKQMAGKMMIEYSTTALITMDAQGIIQEFNPEATRLFGYTKAEIQGKNVKILQPPEVAANHDQYLANYLKTRVKTVVDSTRQVIGRRKDGKALYLEISVTTFEQDGIILYIGYLRDCTESVEMEEATLISGKVINLNPTPFVAMNEIGTVETFNRAAEAEFGYTAAEVVGKNVKMLMPEETAVQHDGYLTRYAQTGIKTVVDRLRQVTARRRDGTNFPVEIMVKEVARGTGKLFLGFVRSRVKEIENTSNAEAAGFLVNWVSSNFIVISNVGIIQDVNDALVQTFGYKAQSDLLGKNIKMLMPEEIAKEHDEYLARYAKTGVKHVLDSKRRLIAKRADGTFFAVEVMVKETFFKETDKKCFAGFIRDVSSEAENQMLSVEAQKVMQMSPDGIIGIDEVGTIQQFSRAAAEKFGYSPNEVLGKNIKMLMPQRYAVEHDGYLSRYKATGERHIIGQERTLPGRKRNGQEFSVELRVTELKRSLGGSYYLGFIRDLSLIQELEVFRARITLASELSAVATIVISETGVILSANQLLVTLFGYGSAAELMNQNVSLLMPRAIAANHDSYLAAYRASGKKHNIDTNRRLIAKQKDGSEITVELLVKELKLINTETHYVGFLRDVRQELTFQAAQSFSSNISSLLVEGSCCYDDTGLVMEWSASAEKWTGFAPGEVLGSKLETVFPGVQLLQPVTGLVENVRVKNGSVRTFRFSVTEVATGVRYFVAVFHEEVSGKKS